MNTSRTKLVKAHVIGIFCDYDIGRSYGNEPSTLVTFCISGWKQIAYQPTI